MIRLQRLSIAVLALCAALAGCAPRGKPPVERIYIGLAERLDAFPVHVLEGKRIVIDPGHGGSFDGALGADSLREADANLGVALYLWGLCKDAGADVHLTRTADRDYGAPGASDARDDLEARVERANALEPDIFISIHHNSNLILDRRLNKIEVYYRSDDTGPSLELAQAIQVHLSRNLGIASAEVRPGNYLVLRSSGAHAAVLGEASYLSHPMVENRLRLAEKQKLEAQAYFLGLIDYYSRGVPRIARLSPASDTIQAPGEIAFSARGDAGVPLDPVSARMRIGATQVIPLCDSASSIMRWAMDPELPNGPYFVQASIRSLRGASGRSRPFTVLLNRPARHVIPLVPGPDLPDSAALSVRVLDELGLPVADGTPVTMSARGRGAKLTGSCRNGLVTFTDRLGLARDTFVVSVGEYAATIVFPRSESKRNVPIRVVDAVTERPVPSPVAAGRSFGSIAGDPAGTILLPSEALSETLQVTARGYRPMLVCGGAVRRGEPPRAAGLVELEPVLGGVLAGRRIAIDAGGGGADPGGRGQSGIRGASVNLAVAGLLRELLEQAGAAVVLTREGEETLSAQERVHLVNRSAAELALGIRSGDVPEGFDAARLVLHYPGSARGTTAADSLASSLAGLPPGGAFTVEEWASPFLQQTACPACEIYCGAIEDEATERAMADAAWARIAARRILAATACYFASAGAR